MVGSDFRPSEYPRAKTSSQVLTVISVSSSVALVHLQLLRAINMHSTAPKNIALPTPFSPVPPALNSRSAQPTASGSPRRNPPAPETPPSYSSRHQFRS